MIFILYLHCLMSVNQKPSCYKCRHYYVTWESSHPYGCRAWKFKTPLNPNIAVLNASGKDCQLFEEKVKN